MGILDNMHLYQMVMFWNQINCITKPVSKIHLLLISCRLLHSVMWRSALNFTRHGHNTEEAIELKEIRYPTYHWVPISCIKIDSFLLNYSSVMQLGSNKSLSVHTDKQTSSRSNHNNNKQNEQNFIEFRLPWSVDSIRKNISQCLSAPAAKTKDGLKSRADIGSRANSRLRRSNQLLIKISWSAPSPTLREETVS